MSKSRVGQKQYAKTSPKAFYLGNDEDKQRRIANLDEAAQLLGLRGASTIVALVADIPPSRLAELLKPFTE